MASGIDAYALCVLQWFSFVAFHLEILEFCVLTMQSVPNIDKIHLTHKSRQETSQRYDVSTHLSSEKQAHLYQVWQAFQQEETESIPSLLSTLQNCGTVALPAAVHDGTPLSLQSSMAILKSYHLHVGGVLGFPNPATRGKSILPEMSLEAFEAWVTAQLGILFAFFKTQQLELQNVRTEGALYQAFYQPEHYVYLERLLKAIHAFDPWLHCVVPLSPFLETRTTQKETSPPWLVELPIGYRLGQHFEPLLQHPLTPEQTRQQLQMLMQTRQLLTLEGKPLTLPPTLILHSVYVSPEHPQWEALLDLATTVVPKVLPATVVASSHSGWVS